MRFAHWNTGFNITGVCDRSSEDTAGISDLWWHKHMESQATPWGAESSKLPHQHLPPTPGRFHAASLAKAISQLGRP